MSNFSRNTTQITNKGSSLVYDSDVLPVGDTIEVSAVTPTANDLRDTVMITNQGPNEVLYGPPGKAKSKRDVLFKNQFLVLPFEKALDVTFICDTGKSATIAIQEAG